MDYEDSKTVIVIDDATVLNQAIQSWLHSYYGIIATVVDVSLAMPDDKDKTELRIYITEEPEELSNYILKDGWTLFNYKTGKEHEQA